MKLVKKIRLVFREHKSDKVYEIDLAELPGTDPARFVVNFRYGRRGRALREGTKTERPVSFIDAEALYQSVVVAKTNEGYYDESGPVPAKAMLSTDAASSSQDQAARLQALLKALEAQTNSKRRARLIWNLGQSSHSEAAEAAVLAHLNRGAWLEDYSIAWTLGRWRVGTSLSVIERLRRHSNPHVREIALESLLLVMPPSQATNELQADKFDLPPAVRSAIDAGDESLIAAALRTLANEPSGALNRALVVCYRLALFIPTVRCALLSFFAQCPLAPGVFKAVRHVFKTAELRLDAEMFACLAQRFETTPAYFRDNWGRAYIPGQGSIVVATELKSESSRLAYSNRTRSYLRKRAWRTLLRLGRADSAHYVPLAKAMLLQMSDDDSVKPRTREIVRWKPGGARRQRETITRFYDGFASFLVFNHILRGANRSYQLNAARPVWFQTRPDGTPVRGERFAHLWDRAPAAALELLKLSRCETVHDAALRMLAGKDAFLRSLSPAEVAQLLLSRYSQTTRFALPLAEALLTRGAGNDTLILALLKSSLLQARELGVRVLAAHPEWITNQTLLIELLLVFAAPVPELVDTALSRATLSEAEQHQIATGVITQLLARDLVVSSQAAEALAQLLIRRLPATDTLPLALLDRLLTHSDRGTQLLGARLLVANRIGFKDIPDRLLQHIHSSVHEEVRAVAIALLSKQRSEDLLQQVETLAELWYVGTGVERAELMHLFDALASGAESQTRMLRALSGLSFRAEHELGQGDELYAFFSRHRGGAPAAFDKDTVWRLLQAQAVTAQRIGALLLQDRPPSELSVKQWARLGHHADLSARRYALAAFEAHENLIKQHTRDALRLLDSPWDDARERGFRFFRERYQATDWSPEYIVGICDSTRADVQSFGRELLQRFFEDQQGPQYLARLSEHPSVNVQLFISNFLEHHAAEHRERIVSLRPYFLTVLSQINKARICKDRVLDFLLREALRDTAVANMAAELFTRASLTVVRTDRSQLIKALIALQAAHPQLVTPLKVLPVRRHPASASVEVQGGV